MPHIRTFISAIILCFAGTLYSQTLHYTLYQFAPTQLNPALTGAFEGTFRVGGIYRDQWSTAASSFSAGYKSPLFYVDVPLIRGFRKTDWVGAGVTFYRYQAGALKFRDSAGLLGVAYHLGFGKDAKTVLSIGGQFGSASRKTGFFDDLDFRDGIIAGVSQEPKDERKGSYTSWNAGVNFSTSPNKESNFRLGVAAINLTEPNTSLGQGQSKLDMTINAYAQYNRVLTDRLRMSPTIYYQTSGATSRIAAQALFGALIKPEKNLVLNFGLGYQASDASDLELILGAEINDLKIGFSFDANMSGLNDATNSLGSFELGVSYIAKIHKKPKVKPVIFCPRF
jgi:type IX secretion system PorP/SprF family membrane protein